MPAANSGSDIQAAAAAAAHRVMTQIYTAPAQVAAANSFFASAVAGIPDGPGKTDGLAWGNLVADGIMAMRSSDQSTAVVSYSPTPGPGNWQPTGPAFAAAALPQWGGVTPWTMTSGSQFRPGGPPDLTGAIYAGDFQQVYDLGGSGSLMRTEEQTDIALFWANGGGTATPPGHWNLIAQNTLAGRIGETEIVDRARLFAALNTSLADAAIAAWDAKYAEDFWRPVTAIHGADGDGNELTVQDLEWEPLLVTPPFPEYVSGHSTFSGAGARILAEIYGTDSVSFTLASEDPSVGVRSFSSLSGAAAESGISRVYGGIHFNSANVDGLTMGNTIGFQTLKDYFQPVPEPTTGGLILAGGLLACFRRRRV